MKAIPEQSYYSYDMLIESMEVEVLAEEQDGDYQGDSFLLVKEGNRYGYLRYGWGSCSGCDALEACRENNEAVTNLRDSMYSQIIWQDSAEQMLQWFNDHDWQAEWCGRSEGNMRLIEQAIALLGGKPVYLCSECGKKIEQKGMCAECDKEVREYREKEAEKARRRAEKKWALDRAQANYDAAVRGISRPWWASVDVIARRLEEVNKTFAVLANLIKYTNMED